MTDKQKENRDKLLLALAILLGNMTQEEIAQTNTFADVPEEAQQKAIVEYKKQDLDKLAESKDLQQPQIQDAMAKIAKAKTSSASKPQYFKVVNPGDGKTCAACKQWIGKILSDEDKSYPSTTDFLKSGGMHPNCRCSLHLLDETTEIDARAQDYLERKRRRQQELEAFEAFNVEPNIELIFI